MNSPIMQGRKISNTIGCLRLMVRLIIRVMILLFIALNVFLLYQHFKKSNGEKTVIFEIAFKNFYKSYLLNVPIIQQCNDITKVAILILSRREVYLNRNAIRNTWAKNKTDTTVLRFFIADENPDKEHINDVKWSSKYSGAYSEYIDKESEYYGDIVFIKGIPETYANLHLMMHAAFQWQQSFCPQAKYVLKTDDDTVVHLGRLDHWIEHKFDKTLGTVNEATCFGCPVINSKPIREPNNRWFVPKSVYPEARYPDYVQGCTYLCSSKAITKILSHTREVNVINMEDVLFTGILAERANVSRSNQPHHFYWSPWFKKEQICRNGVPLITAVFGSMRDEKDFLNTYKSLATVTCK